MWIYECVAIRSVLGYGISSGLTYSSERKGDMPGFVRFLSQVVGAAMLILAIGSSAEARGRLLPVGAGGDLQNQVKTTASKVIPAVVSIASTVMVRDQAFSDEMLPFGLFREPPARRQCSCDLVLPPPGFRCDFRCLAAESVGRARCGPVRAVGAGRTGGGDVP